jgi:hypothetical protein
MSPNLPENDETLESLAHRLRRLPPPPVPASLEARLLAAIPPRRLARPDRIWLAAAMLLAPAACLLLMLRLSHGVVKPDLVKRNDAVPLIASQSPTLWTYEQALRQPDADASVMLDRAGPTFAWPVAGPAATFLSERNIRSLD